MKRPFIIIALLLVVLVLVYALYRYINTSEYNPNPKYTIGQPLDSLRDVVIITSTLCSFLFAFSALQKSLNISIYADFAP